MPLVDTVAGAVNVSELGVTLMHEHIFVLTPDVQLNYPDEFGDEQARIDDAVVQLQRAYDAGVRTIVDPTVVGLGRYIPRIEKIAERTAVNIVAATGIYTYRDIPRFFAFRGAALTAMTGVDFPNPMVEMFIRDIREGIAGTSTKAGMLKCAIDHHGLTDGVELVMRAVAAAHHQTGVPITVHTHPGSETGLAVHRVLCDDEGVDPRRIVLGHSGDSTDVDHLSQLAEMGFTLGFDRFGINLDTTFEDRNETLIEMVRRGYSEQIVLSQDAACYIDWVDPQVKAAMTQWNYTHVFDDVFPYIRERGVTDEQITTMLVGVPRRVLTIAD